MGVQRFAIKHRTTGLYFGSFEHGPEFNPKWVPLSEAKVWGEKLHAESQALLLRRFSHKVQIKPVAV